METFPRSDCDGTGHLPGSVARFIEEADSRVLQYLRGRVPGRRRGFVASDLVAMHAALEKVARDQLAPGPVFCEWGSGFGGVTDLAHMLDFEAYGIEIQAELVHAAEELASDFGLDVAFAHGSFVPPGAEALTEIAEYTWWDAGEPSGYEDLGLAPEECDTFFAYPWPGEEYLVDALFARCAAVGALLVTYHGVSGVRLQRKTGPAPTTVDLGWLE